MYKIISAAVFFFTAAALYSRDIDLDKIYIHESCHLYSKIIDKKIDTYKTAGSAFIDNNTAFADWMSGREIAYIKEHENISIIYLYDTVNHTRSEVARIDGTVTHFRTSQPGKFIALKKFTIEANGKTDAHIVIIKTNPGKIIAIKSSSLFADFTISQSGNSILMAKQAGIYEFSPDFESEKLLIKKNLYEKTKLSGDSNILTYQSPAGNKFAVLNGQAGIYTAAILDENKLKVITGISSAIEFFWIDNNHLAYRKGGPGTFRSIIYSIKNNSEKILSDDSFNTGLYFSKSSKAFSFLNTQLINFYFSTSEKIIQTGLEGEDSSLSPDSTRFLSIYNRNIFITNISVLEKRSAALKKDINEISDMYRELLKLKEFWKNEFSYLYLKRKITAYKNFLKK